MSAYRTRLTQFEDRLSQNTVDLFQLRKLCFHGIPDEHGIRALCWKLLLGYLPPDAKSWPSHLQKQRQTYNQFIDEMIVAPLDGHQERDRADVTLEDHPLSLSPDSRWQTFFKDNEVLLQIDKDVRRLCPDISFFQQATGFPCERITQNPDVERLHKRVAYSMLKAANVTRKGLGVTKMTLSKRKAMEEYCPLPAGQEAHWEVVERILFIYAKLNPGQGYVQGMNEIIGPIYYTFASDPEDNWRAYAEADCFFCFTNLMSEIRDFFIHTLDESESGIATMMSRLSRHVECYDKPLWLRLHQLDLQPQYYSFRWLTLLLSQEFPLPDVIRVWDSLFSDFKRFDFLIHVCCAMLLLLSDQLMVGDFPTNMKLLQNFPAIDIRQVLSKAMELSNT